MLSVLQKVRKAASWMVRHTRSSVNTDDGHGVDQMGFKILTLESKYLDDAEKQLYHDKFRSFLPQFKEPDGSSSMKILRHLRGTRFHNEHVVLASCVKAQDCDLAQRRIGPLTTSTVTSTRRTPQRSQRDRP